METLDQEQSISGSNGVRCGSTRDLAQTFLCGITGRLEKISLHFNTSRDGLAPIVVSILNTSSDLPNDASILASTTLASGPGTGWVDITFSSPPNITKDVLYAIKVTSTDSVVGNPDTLWSVDLTGGNLYANGAFYQNSSGAGWVVYTGGTNPDAAFKTYMIPNPGGFLTFM